jgi:hypothetical protein
MLPLNTRRSTCLFLIFLIGVPNFFNIVGVSSQAQVPQASGTYQMSFVSKDGTSAYSVEYSYPKIVPLNSNFTMAVTVLVTELTSLKLYLIDYGVTVTISTSNGRAVVKQVLSLPGHFLYQGSHWGPLNISIPINSTVFGPAQSAPYNANVSIQFVGDVWYDFPVYWHYYDSQTQAVGNISIVAQPGGNGVIPILTVAASVLAILGVTAVVLYFIRAKRKTVKLEKAF